MKKPLIKYGAAQLLSHRIMGTLCIRPVFGQAWLGVVFTTFSEHTPTTQTNLYSLCVMYYKLYGFIKSTTCSHDLWYVHVFTGVFCSELHTWILASVFFWKFLSLMPFFKKLSVLELFNTNMLESNYITHRVAMVLLFFVHVLLTLVTTNIAGSCYFVSSHSHQDITYEAVKC